MLEARNVLVEFGVDGHQLSPHSEALPMFVLRLDVQDKRDTRREPCHQLLQVLHVQVNTFYDDRLVSHVCTLDYFSELCLHQLGLHPIAFYCDLCL